MLKKGQIEKIKGELDFLACSPLYPERIKNNWKPVLGEGNIDAQVFFIGEAPGKNEALTGKPFCGASGKILDELLSHIMMKREDVYITNIIKDRPTNNRDPKKEEIELYAPFLIKQIQIIRPKVIVTLGRFSMEFILKHFSLDTELEPISKLHGKIYKINLEYGEVYIVPLYHPAVAVYNRKQLPMLKKDFENIKTIIGHATIYR